MHKRVAGGVWIAFLIAATTLISAPVALGTTASTAVIDWNLNAVNALSNPTTPPPPPAPPIPPGAGQTPPVASEHLAMVQGAVFDAVNAIERDYEPYLEDLPHAPRWASKDAAVATAAHNVLVGLVPALPAPVIASLDGLYATSMAAISPGTAKTAGTAIGAAAAAAMLAERADDGRYVPHSFTPGSEPGEWRPELPAFASDPFAWVAKVRPFTLKSSSQFRTDGPYDLDSAEYAADFIEVKALGAATGSTRTIEQTELAKFYSANPLPILNRAFRDLSVGHELSVTQQARLFAMTSMAGADALIGCWDDKDHYSFWRPISAIRGAADDGNPATTAQADWLPFFPTPPYPDHPSGYNCYASALMHTGAAFFGTDKVAFTLTSPGSTTPRSYSRFTAVLKDTIDARILMGIHFRNPDVQGAWLGKHVARWVDRHYFEPVGCHGHHRHR